MVDIFVLRLFVVVLFLLNRLRFNTFGQSLLSRYTLCIQLMMKSFSRLLLLLFLLLSLLPAPSHAQTSSPPAAAPAFGQKLHIAGIHNAGKINDMFFRGAQPREQGLSELKLLGVTTIIDLRGEDREKVAWERQRAESLGMRFVHIPVSGWSPPTDEQVVQFLSLLRSEPGQKVFVHCRFGDDRTGVFTAVYRMAFEKWTPEQALKEMYFFGFNGFWHPSMKSFIRDFPSRMKAKPAPASFANPATQP